MRSGGPPRASAHCRNKITHEWVVKWALGTILGHSVEEGGLWGPAHINLISSVYVNGAQEWSQMRQPSRVMGILC